MKRMVENSEKIEELADIIKIKNGNIITPNITTTGGDEIYIFSDIQVDFDSSFPGTVVLTNLGTALLFEATIESGTPNGKYTIAKIFRSDDSINYVKLSYGNEFNPSIGGGLGPDEFEIFTEFNETLADHTRSSYTLILLIGHYSKES